MINLKNLLRLILLYTVLSPFIQAVQPQDVKKKRRVDIENADLYTYDEKIKKNAVRLIGNVRFRHNNVLMFCDSAYQYNETNIVDAYGNVHINQGDTLNLYGDKINYNGNTRFAKVRGRVKLIDKSITLTTDSLNFDLNTNIGNYNTGGRIVDTSNVLTSINGKYFAKSSLFLFKDSVVLTNKDFVLKADTLKYNSRTEKAFIVGPTTITGTNNGGVLYSEEGWYDTRKKIAELYKASKITNKDQILEGDTLFYDRNTGNARGKHRVVLSDTTNHVKVKGKFGIYNENSKIAFVTDSALFMQIGQKDTLFLHGDTLKTFPDVKDSIKKDSKLFLAYPRVRFYKSDLQGKCDSLSFQMKDSTIFMFYDPVLWAQKNQMTAEKIQYISKKPEPNIARLEKDAFIVMLEDSIRYNQISGKLIVGQIVNGKLHVADVNGNAQTLYYLKNKDKYTGMNSQTSSKIYFHMANNKMDTIRFYPKAEGRVIPLKELTADQSKLKGFAWREKERPKNSKDLYPPEDKLKKVEPKLKAKPKAEIKEGTKEKAGTKSKKSSKTPAKTKTPVKPKVPAKAPVRKPVN